MGVFHRGFAFLAFTSRVEAEAAIELVRGAQATVAGAATITIELAKPRPKAKAKGKGGGGGGGGGGAGAEDTTSQVGEAPSSNPSRSLDDGSGFWWQVG